MSGQKTLFIGVSLIIQPLSFCMVSLDGGLHLINKHEGSLEEALSFCQNHDATVAGLNFPGQPNQDVIKAVNLKRPGPGRPPKYDHNMRLCEGLLRHHGVKIPATPADLTRCPPWMLQGFAFSQRLAEMGFLPYSADGVPYQMLETYAEAVYRSLLGSPLLSQRSLEGHIQRQLLLYEQGMRIADPMDFFEEITRHRLMQGSLPLHTLYSFAELDALASAYIAWLAMIHPQQISQVGSPTEGYLILPQWKELENSHPVVGQQMNIFS